VRFDLVELAPDTTLLTLIQFAPVAGVTGASAGWHHIFEVFTSYVETGAAADKTDRCFEQIKALHQQRGS